MDNRECVCGKEFHYCGTCDTQFMWEEQFCSKECWINSEEYQEVKTNFLKFFDTLKEDQKQYVYDNLVVINFDYEFEMPKWMQEYQEQKKLESQNE